MAINQQYSMLLNRQNNEFDIGKIINHKGRDAFVAQLPFCQQVEYINLLHYFETSEEMNRRNLGLSTFKSHLKHVHKFIRRGDNLDIYRGLVCGIEFGTNFILVNTKRLRVLMNRSKSCVNGCLQKLGYTISRQQQDISGFFSAVLPGINHVFCNSRQWCVRIPNPKINHDFASNLPDEIANSYGISPRRTLKLPLNEQATSLTVSPVSNKRFPFVQFPSEIDTKRKESEPLKSPLWDINLLLNRHRPVECVSV
jgi:hypothetical protein